MIERMNAACLEEFGHTFKEMAEFLNAVITLGLGLECEPKRMPWEQFVAALAGTLARDATWVEGIAKLSSSNFGCRLWEFITSCGHWALGEDGLPR